MLELPAGKILGPYSTREEWLAARRNGIGGSDIGALLGLSTYSSPLQVYYEKIEGQTREVSEQMEIGQDIESWILYRWFDRQTEFNHMSDELLIIQSNEYPFLLHSPDALVEGAGVEIKNIRSDQHWDPLPDFYMAQVQHGLLCSGLERWIVVALVGGQKLITREIEPDPVMFYNIHTKAADFWRSHVLANVPPEPDGSESASDVLNRHWEASQDESVEVPNEMWIDLEDSDKRLKTAEKSFAIACQRIKVLMGDHEQAVNPFGKKVATWKVGTRNSVDITRLKSEAPEVAKKFSKTTPTRVFRPNL